MAKVNKKFDTNQAAKKLVDSSIERLEAKIGGTKKKQSSKKPEKKK